MAGSGGVIAGGNFQLEISRGSKKSLQTRVTDGAEIQKNKCGFDCREDSFCLCWGTSLR